MKHLAAILCLSLAPALAQPSPRWPEAKANAWYRAQPWLVGANYIPATAINELEMWQAATFDPKRIDLELGWAESIGMNTMRVFLHDLLWEQDAAGFRKRIDIFLDIAAKHKVRPMFVLFDSCWDPFPQLGPQRAPKPGVHNSGWVQSPGAKALQDPSQYPRLERYVKGVVGAFAKDARVLAWDIWNEPDNRNNSSYGKLEPKDKVERVLKLLPQGFRVGAFGGAVAAAHLGHLAGRLVLARENVRHGPHPGRAFRRGFVPQLRRPGRIREARALARAV